MKLYSINNVIREFRSTPKSLVGLTDLSKLLKKFLTSIGVTFNDPCCPDTGFAAMRFNTTTNQPEYLSDAEEGTFSSLLSKYREATVASSIAANDSTLNITAGTFTQVIPTANSANRGRVITILNSGSGTITLDPAGAILIDGNTTKVLTTGTKATIQSTGTGWITIG